MAIFLIKDRDQTHKLPAKDAMCYKRGDIVEVFEDTKPCVIPPEPPFVIVKVAGLTKAQAEKFMAPELEGSLRPDGSITYVPVTRRLWHLRWADLPAGVRNALTTSRYYETTLAAVRTYIRNKRTTETY